MTVPPARQCTLPECERAAVDPTTSGSLCKKCNPDESPEATLEATVSKDAIPRGEVEEPASGTAPFADVDFTDPNSGVWPDDRLEVEQWMGRKPDGKLPYAPWTDRDAPAPCNREEHDGDATCAECDHSARYKWGWEGNYVTGDEIAMAEVDPELGGRVFIQRDDDRYAFVDGDNVRCQETGDVHPVFITVLNRLGLTYADISQSDRGVHAPYVGDLPDGVREASWQLDDEPWGGNDEPPTIEIYANKRVCVDTGRHVPGTPLEVRPWDDDALRDLLEEHDQLPADEPDRAGAAFDDFDPDDYDPGATGADETAEDVRDIFAALDQLDAQRVAARTIVAEWNEDAGTSAGEKAFYPTWDRNCNGRANIVNSDRWRDTGDRGGWGGPAVMAAIHASDIPLDERATPADLRRKEVWFDAVDHLRNLGFEVPVYVSEAPDADSDPAKLKALNITLDPDVAWRAAAAVTPDELDDELAVPMTGDGSGWTCPRCEAEIDVVRAAAIDANIVPCCSTPLRDDAYDRAYGHARRGCGAPLPEYMNQETATESWNIVRGAIRQLDVWHLDEDALESEITGCGDDVDGDAQLTLDPAWRDSDSGESVLVFPSGTAYEAHPDHDGALDVLRLVGLDSGAIGWEEFTGDEYQLTGDTFRHVYEIARMYGAPLPHWQGTDAYHTAVLPPAEELVEEDVGEDDRLRAAYDAVADLYTDAARTDTASLLRVLPGLGKTDQVFRNATTYPTLYTAGRKELMQEAAARAETHGASSYILPIFSEHAPPSVVTSTAEAAVREHGQSILRDRWRLVEQVEEALPEDETLCHPDEYDGGGDEDEIALDRESCPTANGAYGLDWWIVVHAARARGYRPQQIHENAPALFGTDLPCTCDDGADTDDEVTCPYTEAWEIATDPEAPFDVLIGHYTHAHVEGARTYATRDHGRVQKDPRVVTIDEFPGEAYQREFGDEYPDLAAWLAASLRQDVDDRQDLFTAVDDLWTDDAIRAWLGGDDLSSEHGRIVTVLESAQDALDAIETAEWLLEARRDACDDLGVTGDLERLVDAHPALDAGTTTAIAGVLDTAVTNDNNRGGHTNTLGHLDDLVDQLREAHFAGGFETDLEEALAAATHVDGALASLVADAADGYQVRDDSARRRIDAAITALEGGADGCEALAMHADDGYAHPLAHTLLYGLLAPSDATDVATVRTDSFTFHREEGTRLSSVGYHDTQVVVDRNHHGAVVNDPPAFDADGGQNPVVGLDATGRAPLWELALGRDVTPRDIHDTPREKRQFMRDVYGLQIVQTSPHANSYEGDPSGKNFDGDVEVVAEIGRQYGVVIGQQPAVITTKVVEESLGGRLDDVAATTAHFGNLKGSNALSEHRLAALLGCQHYGDRVVERWAALAGEEANRTGYGMDLNYHSYIANTVLKHMREDQVMQAALRFGRDSDGALVFAHTAALRDDLPVVAEGEVVRTFSEQAQAIAQAAGDLAPRPRFTAADVRDRIDGHDPTARTVRRVLSELAEFGYLEKTDTPAGHANEFGMSDEPRPAAVELPDVDSRAAETDPGRDPLEVYYTWSVRVAPDKPRLGDHRTVGNAQLPAPGGGETDTSDPDPPPTAD